MFNTINADARDWCVRYSWKSKGKVLQGSTVVLATSKKAVRAFFRKHHSNVRVLEVLD